MTRDLRKKYKIIFFNEQGLEEEGVDGGGIIKEFINRVLRYYSHYLEHHSASNMASSWTPLDMKCCPIHTPLTLASMNLWAG
jgi:hypothetical protein